MEDSKFYSAQDIEKLKQKIDTYRETLTTLKMSTSIEDYLFMKNEFELLKTQIAHLEGLTETIDGKHSMQIKEYEEQVKLLSIQIESLNQAIEEMNQEIFSILNKLITVESNAVTEQMSANVDESSIKIIAHPPRKLFEEIAQTAAQPPLPTTEPTYKFLQSLAGKASNMNNGIPLTTNDTPVKKQEERHFNQHYFQSIQTHPSQIYNGLFRNNTAESTFHFKNATDTQGIPISILETNSLTAPIAEIDASLRAEDPLSSADDLEKVEATSPIADDLEEIEATSPTADDLENTEAASPTTDDLEKTKPVSPIVNDLVIAEPSSSIVQVSVHTHSDSSPIAEENTNIDVEVEESRTQIAILEEFNSQPEDIQEVVEEEPKKEKNSLFFNLFRRRN